MARRALRRSLTTWSEHALEPFGLAPASHHRLLIERLESVAAGHTRRLMVCMPPGSAKSTYASVLFPAWYLAQGRDRSVIGASHTLDLAATFSRRVRGMVREHGPTLGYGLRDESVERWTTTNGGEYRAVGVGGAIAGFRADLAVIDDPVKSREAADSDTERSRAWNWWLADITPRLKPGAAVVLIMTRWHEDDLAGRLIEREGDRWHVLSLPALAEADDPLGRALDAPLWTDDGYGYGADLLSKRETADARTWSALYQQRPAPDTGEYFRREWLRPALSLPPLSQLRVYGASDYAVTAHGGDYTVHVVVGMDADEGLWLLDVWRGQSASDVWIETFCDLVAQWKPIGWAEETGQIRAGIGPFLDRRMRERRAMVARQQFPTRGDKAVRAQSIRGRMALRGLNIPAAAPWRADLEAELMSFPAGKHDDQVDALGLVGQLLDVMTRGPAAKRTPAQVDRWDRAFARASDGGRTWMSA